MPNYVNNTLRIRGKQEERQRFLDSIFVPRPTLEAFEAQERAVYMNQRIFKDDPDGFAEYIARNYEKTTDTLQILHTLFPCPSVLYKYESPARGLTPEEAARRLTEYGALDWYTWCNANWGSKWGDLDVKPGRHDDKITVLTFRSAWSSPRSGIIEVSNQFPALRFRVTWKEEDVYWGMYSCRNGKIKQFLEGRYR